VQRALLARAARVVVPGGVLVYSTCTLLPEENEGVVESFLRESPEFALAPASDVPEQVRGFIDASGFLRCWPHRHDTDGFFAARLERKSASRARQAASCAERAEGERRPDELAERRPQG